MKAVQVAVFKAEFSEILHQVKDNGESFIIEYGKNHKKVALFVPYQDVFAPQKSRVFGYMRSKGSCVIHDDFKMTDDDFLK
jgi:hypothetical protein